MKPILILLSVFLLAGCWSDFDKCMNNHITEEHSRLGHYGETVFEVKQKIKELLAESERVRE